MPQLEATRKMLAEYSFPSNDDCITCDRDGDCGIQDLAFRYALLGYAQGTFSPIWKEILDPGKRYLRLRSSL